MGIKNNLNKIFNNNFIFVVINHEGSGKNFTKHWELLLEKSFYAHLILFQLEIFFFDCF